MKKKQMLLNILLMWSFWSFSQTLIPKVQSIENEIHFCFTIPQSRIIAQYLTSKVINDSIVHVLEAKQKISRQLTESQRKLINSYQENAKRYTSIIKLQNEVITKAQSHLEYYKKAHQKSRRKSKFMGIGMIAISSILILK